MLNIILQKAKFYSKELWKKEFDLPIIVNARLKCTLGSICYNNEKERLPIRMELSRELFSEWYNEFTVDDILIHELCHWYCSTTGKQSSDFSTDFINELKYTGASPTNTIMPVGIWYYGECSKCGNKMMEVRTRNQLEKYLNTNIYYSKCCHAQISYGGINEYQDEHKVSQKIIDLNNKYKQYYIKISA